MTDPVIDESGAPVVIELLYERHRSPVLSEADSVEAALNTAEWIEAEGSGSTVAVLVAGVVRQVHGPETDWEWRPASEFPDLADKALRLAAESRAYDAEAERRHGVRRLGAP